MVMHRIPCFTAEASILATTDSWVAKRRPRLDERGVVPQQGCYMDEWGGLCSWNDGAVCCSDFGGGTVYSNGNQSFCFDGTCCVSGYGQMYCCNSTGSCWAELTPVLWPG
jgi:hypothetical protein